MIGKRDSLGRIDLSDPNNLNNKVLPEEETRRKLLLKARKEGFEKDLLLLFAKYDKLMRNAKDDKERKDIAKLGAFEVWKLVGSGGELYVNNELVAKE
jgi:hypothetical protein